MIRRLAGLVCCLSCASPTAPPLPARTVTIGGHVLATTGAPIAGALVTVEDRRATTGADGAFILEVPEGTQVVRATAPGRRARAAAVAADDGAVVDLRLPGDDGAELVFTGDAAFAGPGLPDDDGGFAALVAPIVRLTADADAVVVSLLGVVGGGSEPHPTQPFVLASPPAAAAALRALGATVAALANEHAYDFLDEGIGNTLAALGRAGATPLGAGSDERSAYATAVVQGGGVRVGLAAFSALTGRPGEYFLPQPPYFDAVGGRGGVARLDNDRVVAAVAELRAKADRVVVILHAGTPFSTDVAPEIVDAAHRAIDAGADLVVGHGARIAQGIEAYGHGLIFYGLGDLARREDERVAWSGVLLRVHLPAVGPIDASLAPVFLEDLAPLPAAGQLGRAILRAVGERSAAGGVTVLDDGRVLAAAAAALPGQDDAGTRDAAVDPLEGATVTLEDVLGPNRYLEHLAITVPTDGALWLGRDLLGTGDHEDVLADGRFGATTGVSAGSSTRVTIGGVAGSRLALSVCRSGTSSQTAIASSDGRLPVGTAQAVSLCGCWRGDAGTTGAARLSFWDGLDPTATALGTATAVSGPAPADWACFCRAASVPPAARYVDLRVEHVPTAEDSACVDYDALRLIAWEPQLAAQADLAVPNAVGFARVTGAADVARATVSYRVREVAP